jgi:hypothetical protein
MSNNIKAKPPRDPNLSTRVEGPHIHPPQGAGSIAGALLKLNGEFFLASHGLTFEILAGGPAKDVLQKAGSGAELQISGNFKMLDDPRGGPVRRVLETDDVKVTVPARPVDAPRIHPPQGHGSIAGTLVTKNSEFFLVSNGLEFEILAGGAAKSALKNARSGDKLQITGEFATLADPSGGPMRRVLETQDVAVVAKPGAVVGGGAAAGQFRSDATLPEKELIRRLGLEVKHLAPTTPSIGAKKAAAMSTAAEGAIGLALMAIDGTAGPFITMANKFLGPLKPRGGQTGAALKKLAEERARTADTLFRQTVAKANDEAMLAQIRAEPVLGNAAAEAAKNDLPLEAYRAIYGKFVPEQAKDEFAALLSQTPLDQLKEMRETLKEGAAMLSGLGREAKGPGLTNYIKATNEGVKLVDEVIRAKE